MTSTAPRLAPVELPSFGRSASRPLLPDTLYAERIARLRERARDAGHTHIVVYADREHSANLSFLTGFDPRFEEAVLILGVASDAEPAILVGNECWGLAGSAPLPMRRHRYQELSLPSQPRDRSETFPAILAAEGVGPRSRVGVVGWKPLWRPELLDIPSYLADDLRACVGSAGAVTNATALLIDPADGLRIVNEVEQLAAFEDAACRTSEGVLAVLRGVRPGMTEAEAVALLGWDGSPLSCHLMLTAGPRATFGLHSPSDRPIARGDRFTVAFGIWGALNCRAGFVVESASELPDGIPDYVERLVAPYFAAIAEWYTALRIGVTGGELFAIIERHLGDPFFGLFLNPGHQLHLDEWVNSPIWSGSPIELRSGMCFQADIIPATGTPYFTTNIEDGLALADGSLRAAFAARYPEAWARIEARRSFMAASFGHRAPSRTCCRSRTSPRSCPRSSCDPTSR